MMQVVQTPEQQTYLAQLLGYDYTTQFRSGKANVVANALLRIPELPPNTMLSLSVPCLTFLEELKQHLASNPAFNELRQTISATPIEHQDYSLANNLIMHHGGIWLPSASPFTQTLLKEYHSSPIGGHFGISKTLARTSRGLESEMMLRNFLPLVLIVSMPNMRLRRWLACSVLSQYHFGYGRISPSIS